MKLNSLLFADNPDSKGKRRIPLFYVPSIYFAEGLPWVAVNLLSVPMYSKLGIPNSQIGLFTSLLAWPWIVKMLWGPLVDTYKTKRTWILAMQSLSAVLFLLTAVSLTMNAFFFLSLLVFTVMAFVSATHDIAIDGFYMLSLSKKQQAFFIGIRSLFYRIAMIFGTGALVYAVGKLENLYGVTGSWAVAFVVCSALFIVLTVFHAWYLPYPVPDFSPGQEIQKHIERSESYSLFFKQFKEVFKEFFTQKKIIPVIAFILLYRFGEALLTKMVPPFLLNPAEQGGLGISTEDFGLIQGIIGLTSLIFGGILGGWFIARFGLRNCIWPMAIALNLPNLLYIYLAFSHPSLMQVGAVIAVEQLGYGLGFSAFMMFLISISKGQNRTSLYAIATGVMALGLMLPGMVSGFIQEWVGYGSFFIIATLLTLPGMFTIFFIPISDAPD